MRANRSPATSQICKASKPLLAGRGAAAALSRRKPYDKSPPVTSFVAFQPELWTPAMQEAAYPKSYVVFHPVSDEVSASDRSRTTPSLPLVDSCQENSTEVVPEGTSTPEIEHEECEDLFSPSLPSQWLLSDETDSEAAEFGTDSETDTGFTPDWAESWSPMALTDAVLRKSELLLEEMAAFGLSERDTVGFAEGQDAQPAIELGEVRERSHSTFSKLSWPSLATEMPQQIDNAEALMVSDTSEAPTAFLELVAEKLTNHLQACESSKEKDHLLTRTGSGLCDLHRGWRVNESEKPSSSLEACESLSLASEPEPEMAFSRPLSLDSSPKGKNLSTEATSCAASSPGFPCDFTVSPSFVDDQDLSTSIESAPSVLSGGLSPRVRLDSSQRPTVGCVATACCLPQVHDKLQLSQPMPLVQNVAVDSHKGSRRSSYTIKETQTFTITTTTTVTF